jgi:hypothetical protein
MKFRNLIGNILTEASKKDVLIKKLGIKETEANVLSTITGPLAVFFAYKILEKYELEYYFDLTPKRMKVVVDQKSTQERFGLFNGSNSASNQRDKLRSIMDWVRVALNGNINAYKELSFDDLYDESERWHESLGVGESKIDYKEDNDIILDFRKDDEGYYWVDLGGTNCPDEAERMGHCASSRGNLYSLRSFKKIENKHTLNRSHLTASINGDGDLLQLKGQKNSKPTSEYHSLILPLFYVKIDNEYLISSFGYEYNSSNDFKLSDLSEDEVKKIYSDRPELFSGRQEIKLLKTLGLIEPTRFDYKFVLNISPNNAEKYIRGEMTNIIDDILTGDTWKFWDNYEYADWRLSIQYHIDDVNTKKIIEMLRNTNGFDESLSLTDLIEECDETDEIKHALRLATNDAESDDYSNYLYKQLNDAFSHYGKVQSMNDEGVNILIDLEQLITDSKIDDETVDEISERCENEKGFDPECLFEELLGDGYIEKPRFDADDRWYPSVDNGYFNEILSDRLNEI